MIELCSGGLGSSEAIILNGVLENKRIQQGPGWNRARMQVAVWRCNLTNMKRHTHEAVYYHWGTTKYGSAQNRVCDGLVREKIA